MLTAPRLISLLLVLLLPWPTMVAADEDVEATRANVREAFSAALAAVPADPTLPAGGDSEALQRYPLYPYLQAARLSRQLELVRPLPGAAAEPVQPLDDEV